MRENEVRDGMYFVCHPCNKAQFLGSYKKAAPVADRHRQETGHVPGEYETIGDDALRNLGNFAALVLVKNL